MRIPVSSNPEMLKIGGENPRRIKLLLELTSIRSKKLVNITVDYYVTGILNLKGFKSSNFDRANERLKEVDKIIDKLDKLK